MVKGLLIRPEGPIEEINVISTEDLNHHIGGTFTIYPHPKGSEASHVAYAHDEGILLQLPTNYKAWTVLHKLGHHVPSMGVWGPVVILGNKDGKNISLLKATREIIQKALTEDSDDD